MANSDGEADGQGGRSQASVSSLIGHGEDADHKLHGEENLHGGRHPQTDAWLQLEVDKSKNKSQSLRDCEIWQWRFKP